MPATVLSENQLIQSVSYSHTLKEVLHKIIRAVAVINGLLFQNLCHKLVNFSNAQFIVGFTYCHDYGKIP